MASTTPEVNRIRHIPAPLLSCDVIESCIIPQVDQRNVPLALDVLQQHDHGSILPTVVSGVCIEHYRAIPCFPCIGNDIFLEQIHRY